MQSYTKTPYFIISSRANPTGNTHFCVTKEPLESGNKAIDKWACNHPAISDDRCPMTDYDVVNHTFFVIHNNGFLVRKENGDVVDVPFDWYKENHSSESSFRVLPGDLIALLPWDDWKTSSEIRVVNMKGETINRVPFTISPCDNDLSGENLIVTKDGQLILVCDNASYVLIP